MPSGLQSDRTGRPDLLPFTQTQRARLSREMSATKGNRRRYGE